MTVAVSGDSITFNDNSVQATAPKVGMVNRVINGGMTIDQRNAGASVTLSSSAKYPVDRFAAAKDTAAATCTSQRSTTVPSTATFTNSVLWTTSTGASPASGDDNVIYQYIEGFNFADLGFGTSAAQSFTFSFWARSSVTGTYGVSLANSAATRCYMATYSIAVANTWEFKTITVAGDTTGTWLTDNGIGLRIFWDMGSGTSRSIAASSVWGSSYGTGLTGGVKIAATTGATFYITGVQLEKGSTATSFDYRPYGTELGLCQRYLPAFPFQAGSHNVTVGMAYGTTLGLFEFPLPVTTRVAPTGMTYTATATNVRYYVGSTANSVSSLAFNDATFQSAWVSAGISASNAQCLMLATATSESGTLYFTGCEL